eukprot:COSAG03_NODE_8001_length_847_cov_0.935829_1_plen_86_part_00
MIADLGAPGAGSLALPAESFLIPMAAALLLRGREEERLEPPLRASHRTSTAGFVRVFALQSSLLPDAPPLHAGRARRLGLNDPRV